MKNSIFKTIDELGWPELTITNPASAGQNKFHFSTNDKKITSLAIERLLKKNCGRHFHNVLELIRTGRHEKVEFIRHRLLDVGVLICIHSITLGSPAGGIRRHEPAERELSVIRDTLNLSRAMSFKDAAAGLPNGGSKLGVISRMPDKDTPDAYYKFLAGCIERSGSFTGPDMGFTLRDANRMRKFTRNIVGGTAKTGSHGATGKSAAYGVLLAMKESARARYGNPSLRGKKIAIQGLGQLGGSLVKFLIREGAELIITDTNAETISKTLAYARAGNGTVRAVSPPDIYTVRCAIFSPCAVGGVITRETARRLRCDMVVSGANNPLNAASRQEELSIGRLLARRNILFLPDWIANAGGVIHGQEEHKYGRRFSLKRVYGKIRLACQSGAREILESADRQGLIPLQAAYQKYEKVIFNHR